MKIDLNDNKYPYKKVVFSYKIMNKKFNVYT